jgi:hypothetical protein
LVLIEAQISNLIIREAKPINFLFTLPISLADLMILIWITISFIDTANEMISKRLDIKAAAMHQIAYIVSLAIFMAMLLTASIVYAIYIVGVK